MKKKDTPLSAKQALSYLHRKERPFFYLTLAWWLGAIAISALAYPNAIITILWLSIELNVVLFAAFIIRESQR